MSQVTYTVTCNVQPWCTLFMRGTIQCNTSTKIIINKLDTTDVKLNKAKLFRLLHKHSYCWDHSSQRINLVYSWFCQQFDVLSYMTFFRCLLSNEWVVRTFQASWYIRKLSKSNFQRFLFKGYSKCRNMFGTKVNMIMCEYPLPKTTHSSPLLFCDGKITNSYVAALWVDDVE